MWMLRVACPSVTAWLWCGWAGSLSTWGPAPHLGPCAAPGGGRFGTWGFHSLCVSTQKILCGSSVQLLTGVQRSLRLVPLGASHPSGVAPAGLVPHRWSGELLVPGKSHSVPHSWVVVWQSGCWSVSGNLHPLERLVLPGVELDGWKTELKMASLGSVQGLDRRGSCSVQPPGACGEGQGLSALSDGLCPRWVCLSSCTQGCSKTPGTWVRLGLVGG